MQTTIIAAVMAALTTQSIATIVTGVADFSSGSANGHRYHVAWIKGEDACQWTWVSNYPDAPCDHPFTLSNGHTYVLKYCGTSSFALYNGDGSFNHFATQGTPYTADNCVNKNGRYKVTKDWEF